MSNFFPSVFQMSFPHVSSSSLPSNTASSSSSSPSQNSMIWLLGRRYGPIEEKENRWGEYAKFLKDFHSRLWFTYRHGFEDIKPTSLSSDGGWGCMLRSGQMLLGEVLIRHILGNDWRLGYNLKDTVQQYVEILSWFLDRMAPESPFSLHRIAIMGRQFGKQIGEWFGPATISSVIQALVTSSKIGETLAVHVASDGVVYKDKLAEACCGVANAKLLPTQDGGQDQGEPEKWKGLLLMIPLRLGLESVNSIYEESLKECFRDPHCVGIAGGRPNASLFFVGYEGENLIYLDPHFSRPNLELSCPLEECTEKDFESYHCGEVRKIEMGRIDPSLLLGFYCQDRKSLIQFLKNFQNHGKNSIFTIGEVSPVYNDAVDMANFDDENSSEFDLI